MLVDTIFKIIIDFCKHSSFCCRRSNRNRTRGIWPAFHRAWYTHSWRRQHTTHRQTWRRQIDKDMWRVSIYSPFCCTQSSHNECRQTLNSKFSFISLLENHYLCLLPIIPLAHVLVWPNTLDIGKLRDFSSARAFLRTAHLIRADPGTVGRFKLSIFAIVTLTHIVIESNATNVSEILHFNLTRTLWWSWCRYYYVCIDDITLHYIQGDPFTIVTIEWNIFSI